MLLIVSVINLDFPANVDSVVISPGGAFLFVKLKVNAKGNVDIVISKLPTSNREDVKVKVRNGILSNLGFETQKLPYDLDTYRDLEEKYKATEKSISYINAELSKLNYYINLLNAFLEGVRKGGKEGNIKEYLDFSSQLPNYSIKVDSLSKILEDMNKRLDSLRNQKNKLLSEQGVMTLYIEEAKDPIVDIVIFYPLGKLNWKPEYNVEYKTNGDMKISALAKFISELPRKISSKKVIITNITPTFSAPTHTPWYISDFMSVPATLSGGPKLEAQAYVPAIKAKSLKMKKEEEEEEEEPVVDVYLSKEVFTPISTKFVIEKEIIFDKFKPAITELFEKNYKVNEMAFIYPELSEKGYINVIFTPDVDLPAGNLKVLFNGEFSADYFYNGTQRGEEDTIFLGFDQFITGKVKLLEQKRRDISGKEKTVLTREERIYEITITNSREKEVEIVLFVRKPFSSGNVNIIDLSFNPVPEKDLGNGLLMWKVFLKPKESFTVKRSITITYPKGNLVNW